MQTYRTRSRGSRGSRRNTRLGRGCYILSKHLEDWLITIEWSKIYNLALYKYHQSCHQNYYHYLVTQHAKGPFLLLGQTSTRLNTNMKEIINKFKIVIKIYLFIIPNSTGGSLHLLGQTSRRLNTNIHELWKSSSHYTK